MYKGSFAQLKINQLTLITTIAILGAVESNISFVAKRIAIHYRILLFDKNAKKLAEMHKQLLANNPFANIEKMNCATDASWEADIIILSETCCTDTLIIEKIKQVSTGKIVIVVNKQTYIQPASMDYLTLQKSLKHVKLIQVGSTINNTKTDLENKLTIKGINRAALETVSFLFTSVGFTSQHILTSISLPQNQ